MLKTAVNLEMQRSSTRICDNCRKRLAGRFAHRELRHAGLLDRHADKLLQLSGRFHLADDVAASNELPVDLELWIRRPLGERLDSIPDLGGTKYIDRFVAGLQLVEDLHDLGRESALRHAASSLHEEDDPVLGHEFGNLFSERFAQGHGCSFRIGWGSVWIAWIVVFILILLWILELA